VIGVITKEINLEGAKKLRLLCSFSGQPPARRRAPPTTAPNRPALHHRNPEHSPANSGTWQRLLQGIFGLASTLSAVARPLRTEREWNRTSHTPRIHRRYGSTPTCASYGARCKRFRKFSSPFVCIQVANEPELRTDSCRIGTREDFWCKSLADRISLWRRWQALPPAVQSVIAQLVFGSSWEPPRGPRPASLNSGSVRVLLTIGL